MSKIRTHRRPYFSKELAALQADLLATAERIWKASTHCDTAVRDTVADGLARLVYVAYDCEGVNKGLGSSYDDSFDAHREWSTEKWFKDHGFADWYAKGAATLFHTMRLPSFQFLQVSHRRRRTKKAA